MAELTYELSYVLELNVAEMDLVHNLLHSGPRLGYTGYAGVAKGLLETLNEELGEIEAEDELFEPTEDFEGFEWTERAKSLA